LLYTEEERKKRYAPKWVFIETVKLKGVPQNLFFDDDTVTYLEIDGEIKKELGCGDLHNRNCVRCTYPEQYDEYKDYDEG
jgi:hypothetical protein